MTILNTPRDHDEYDPSRYLEDPEHPEFQCPVCDLELESSVKFEWHTFDKHDKNDLIHSLRILLDHNWQMEKLIRKLTGKQSYEVIK